MISITDTSFHTDDEDQQDSQHVMAELENIDDECDSKGIAFVKIDNDDEAKEYGIDHLPTLVYFEKGTPYVYSGMCMIVVELYSCVLLDKQRGGQKMCF